MQRHPFVTRSPRRWATEALGDPGGALRSAYGAAGLLDSQRGAGLDRRRLSGMEPDSDVLVQLLVSNLLGQNAPAIAAMESDYEQVWAEDMAAMVGYHGGASAGVAKMLVLAPWPCCPVRSVDRVGAGDWHWGTAASKSSVCLSGCISPPTALGCNIFGRHGQFGVGRQYRMPDRVSVPVAASKACAASWANAV